MTAKPLDHIAALIEAYDKTLDEAEKWAKAAEVLKKRIQAEIGDAHEATINGAPVFTWRPAGKFAAARFGKDHPDLVAKYTRPVTRDELDVAALEAEQPDLYTAYRGRVFLRK